MADGHVALDGDSDGDVGAARARDGGQWVEPGRHVWDDAVGEAPHAARVLADGRQSPDEDGADQQQDVERGQSDQAAVDGGAHLLPRQDVDGDGVAHDPQDVDHVHDDALQDELVQAGVEVTRQSFIARRAHGRHVEQVVLVQNHRRIVTESSRVVIHYFDGCGHHVRRSVLL